MQGFTLPQLPQIGLPSFPVAPIQIPAPMLPQAAAPATPSAPAYAAPAAAPAAAPKAVAAPAPAAASKAVAAPAPAAAAPAVPAAAAVNRVVLSGDALFKSGKSGIKDLSQDGKAKLDEVVAKLKGMGEIDQIKVLGHADPTGNAKANLKLSEARAKSIKSYLIAKGVKPNVIISSGVGDTQPLVECASELPKDQLKECHAPNRRVEIEILVKSK
jgi:outer membrane protein OmpA-like peptidoglycan-associated protein